MLRLLPMFAVLALFLILSSTGPPGARAQESGAGSVTVLTPESYPLVGGIWATEIDIAGGGDLRVSAADGTAFGTDVEFEDMRRPTGGSSAGVQPTSVGGDGSLLFEDVAEGRWTFSVRVLTDGSHGLLFEMDGQTARAANTASFASVTSTVADGNYKTGQSIDIRVSFTEPVSLERFSIENNGSDAGTGTFETLRQPEGITVHTIENRHYALVASRFEDSVQIIDITDPASPTSVASVTDGAVYPALDNPYDIATHTIGNKHYALVAAFDDSGVQIINITDPANPSAVADITDDATYPVLVEASGRTLLK